MEALPSKESRNNINIATFVSMTDEIASVMESLPVSYSKTLCEHMKRIGCTVETLSAVSGLTDRTIKRHRMGEILRPPLANVIAICVGLKLHPIYSFDLIAKAGHHLTSSKEDTVFNIVLLSMADMEIAEINKYLKAVGVKPL